MRCIYKESCWAMSSGVDSHDAGVDVCARLELCGLAGVFCLWDSSGAWTYDIPMMCFL